MLVPWLILTPRMRHGPPFLTSIASFLLPVLPVTAATFDAVLTGLGVAGVEDSQLEAFWLGWWLTKHG